MKATKLLPILAVVLCVPGIALRALHLLNGFDVSTGLPTAGDKWIWFVIALFAISAIVYAVLALPLKTRNKVPFEQLLGTKEALFRMAAVVAGLIVAGGSLGYLYLTITTAEQDVAAWARVLEIVYAIMGVLTGGCMIGLAKAQGVQMTEKSAAMTLVPLFWSWKITAMCAARKCAMQEARSSTTTIRSMSRLLRTFRLFPVMTTAHRLPPHPVTRKVA